MYLTFLFFYVKIYLKDSDSMILTYNNKYKDRQPEETIEILKKFFISKNFQLKLVSNLKNEIDAWSCRWELYYNNIFIVGQNGKGITENYSLASGLAELYERFCNIPILFAHNVLWNRQLINHNWDIHRCNFTVDEYGIRSIDNYFRNIPSYMKDFYVSYLGDSYKDFINLITDNYLLGIPYTEITSDQENTLYFDFRLINRTNGTFGMCAGNSREEALVQGMAELFEIYDTFQYYDPNSNLNVSLIDESLIRQNDKLNTLINNIYNIGDYSLKFFYIEENLPVIGINLIRNYDNVNIINFGASPYFDIAVERCLTEIYQGLCSQNLYIEQNPMENFSIQEIWSKYPGAVGKSGFIKNTDNIHIQSVLFEQPPIFLKQNLTQLEIFNYMIQIAQLKGISFYVRDMSLCEEVKAYHIIPSFNISKHLFAKHMLSSLEKEDLMNQLKADLSFFDKYIVDKNNINYTKELLDYLQNLINYNNDSYHLASFGFHNLMGPNDDILTIVLSLVANDSWDEVQNLLPNTLNLYLYPSLCKFNTILNFRNNKYVNNLYSLNDIKNSAFTRYILLELLKEMQYFYNVKLKEIFNMVER